MNNSTHKFENLDEMDQFLERHNLSNLHKKITENLNRFMSISSAGEESACNAGDPGLIPGSGSFPGEGIGYPFQCSWDSLMTQMVKNLLAMPETLARSLGWEDPLKEGMATHCNILVWRIPWTEEPGALQSMGLLRVRHG